MADKRGQLITGWTGTGQAGDPRRASVNAAHVLISYRDVTGQPSAQITPDPNMYTVEFRCTPTVLTALEADPAYFVLWSEDVPDGE